ncbi:hypothetical protein MLD38_010946 [Melastoma candidum]|uniref:Uncharacterized protein n=1 Tax=Melastoma candidum TaxID=119954 RepID=A0ACB9R1H9_9MYRT|nr:hypothetical protein MLD38_010946 [Melastoma candidum]
MPLIWFLVYLYQIWRQPIACPKTVSNLKCESTSIFTDGTSALVLPVAAGAYVYTLIFVTVPSLASVYNEYALKSQYDTSIYLQNLFLYGYGAISNFLVDSVIKGAPDSKACGAQPKRPRGPRACAITKTRKGLHLSLGSWARLRRRAPLEAPLTNRLGSVLCCPSGWRGRRRRGERLARKRTTGGRRRRQRREEEEVTTAGGGGGDKTLEAGGRRFKLIQSTFSSSALLFFLTNKGLPSSSLPSPSSSLVGSVHLLPALIVPPPRCPHLPCHPPSLPLWQMFSN